MNSGYQCRIDKKFRLEYERLTGGWFNLSHEGKKRSESKMDGLDAKKRCWVDAWTTARSASHVVRRIYGELVYVLISASVSRHQVSDVI